MDFVKTQDNQNKILGNQNQQTESFFWWAPIMCVCLIVDVFFFGFSISLFSM